MFESLKNTGFCWESSSGLCIFESVSWSL